MYRRRAGVFLAGFGAEVEPPNSDRAGQLPPVTPSFARFPDELPPSSERHVRTSPPPSASRVVARSRRIAHSLARSPFCPIYRAPSSSTSSCPSSLCPTSAPPPTLPILSHLHPPYAPPLLPPPPSRVLSPSLDPPSAAALLAASAVSRPSASPPVQAPQPADEDLISRSLLDSIDSSLDPARPRDIEREPNRAFPAKPPPPQDSASYIIYRSQQHHPDSPTMHYHNSAASPIADVFSKKQPAHSLYNALQPLPQDVQESDQPKPALNGFHPQYRAPVPFAAFPNPRPRPQAVLPGAGGGFRDSFSQPYPTATEVFAPAHGPVQQPPHLVHPDPLSPSRLFDYEQALPNPKSHFGALPVTQDTRFGSGSSLLQSQQVQVSKSAHSSSAQPPQQQQQQQQQANFATFSMPNGISAPPPPPQFVHPPAAPAPGPNLPSSSQNNSGEEISTIFVVGFPEDMQEREFQNMFTFSSGFEAATLKIPNKDSNAYGANAGQQPNAMGRQNGFGPGFPGFATDVFTSDVQTALWPPTHADDHFSHSSTTQAPTVPPRKQIIGFAKFKSRAEALEARDTLQGRRVDIEKGAVLKAEMAKKNLHTKRGVGPLGLPMSLVGTGATVGPETLAGLAGMNGLVSPSGLGAGEALAQRERELGAIGAMGLAGVAGRPRERVDEVEEKLRRATITGPPGIPVTLARREEERRRESDAAKFRQNVAAYDAFHSVPAQSARAPGGVVSPTETAAMSSFPLTPPSAGPGALGGGSVQPFSSQDVFAPVGTAATWGLSSGLPDRYPAARAVVGHNNPPSDPTQSPPLNDSALPLSSEGLQPLSPPQVSSHLPLAMPGSNRSYSPPSGGASGTADARSQPTSSSSSVSGSQGSDGEEMARSVVSTGTNDATSPQPASPASGGSSLVANMNHRSNATDQNPPINTLYVGNLPTGPLPGYPPNHLEDSLRSLFERCPGYRQLCFRQKSNGPMCFVEFDDVPMASRAMSELYGNNLGGLVKNGIRLSYSKNPLGVRTQPTGAASSTRQDPPHPGPIGIQEVFQSRHMSPVHSPPQMSLPMEIGHGRPRAEDAQLGYGPFAASPPSRFFSPPPGSHPRPGFGLAPLQQPQLVRPHAYAGQTSNVFGPIGALSPSSPPLLPQGMNSVTLNDNLDDRYMFSRDLTTHTTTPSPGLEVTRAA